MKVDPSSVAFDIDGVVADTINLFLDIAREDFRITDIKYGDITSYMIEECLNVERKIIWDIFEQIESGKHSVPLNPIEGAPEVLERLVKMNGSILFVTARQESGPIGSWLDSIIPEGNGNIDLVATGSFEAKIDILKNKEIRFFVEDRIETCFLLEEAGITPVLFTQPWNRIDHSFIEVSSWEELGGLMGL